MASLLLMRLPLMSLLSPFFVSLSLQLLKFLVHHIVLSLSPDHINWRVLTVGNRRIVYDLVVQAAQRGKIA
jgi:hypothetical protein